MHWKSLEIQWLAAAKETADPNYSTWFKCSRWRRLVAFLSFPFCKDLYSETTSKTHSTYHKCCCLTHLEDLCTPISLWKLCKGVTYGRPKFNTRNGAVGAIFHFDISLSMEKIWGVLKFSVYHFRVSNRPEVATVQPLYSSEEEPGRKLFIKACDLWLDLFLFDSLSGFTIKYADCTLSSHRWNRSIGRTVLQFSVCRKGKIIQHVNQCHILSALRAHFLIWNYLFCVLFSFQHVRAPLTLLWSETFSFYMRHLH